MSQTKGLLRIKPLIKPPHSSMTEEPDSDQGEIFIIPDDEYNAACFQQLVKAASLPLPPKEEIGENHGDGLAAQPSSTYISEDDDICLDMPAIEISAGPEPIVLVPADDMV